MRFSASRIKSWSNCSLQAHYKYDLSLPQQTTSKLLFGQVMHRVVEYFNITGDLDGAKTMFKKDWGLVDPDRWIKFTSYAGLRAKGLEILEATATHYRFQDRRVIGTEIGFVVPFGEHELHGYIDCLEIQKSGTGKEMLKIIDYKTNSRDPTKNDLALDLQFTCYSYAINQKEFWTGMPGEPNFPGVENGEWLWNTLPGMPQRCIWFSLWNGRQLDAGPRTELDYGRLYRVCTEIDKANKAEIYVPKIGEACTYCDFVEQCSMQIPPAVAALEDKTDQTRWV